MDNFEKFVSLLERLDQIYREVIIFILLLTLFSKPLIDILEKFNG